MPFKDWIKYILKSVAYLGLMVVVYLAIKVALSLLVPN